MIANGRGGMLAKSAQVAEGAAHKDILEDPLVESPLVIVALKDLGRRVEEEFIGSVAEAALDGGGKPAEDLADGGLAGQGLEEFAERDLVQGDLARAGGREVGGGCALGLVAIDGEALSLAGLDVIMPQPFMVIWNRAPIPRSKIVSDYVASTNGHIMIERHPAYAPELNPAEYIWAHLKQHEIGNLLVKEAWQLRHYASGAFKRMRRRPRIIRACFSQASL